MFVFCCLFCVFVNLLEPYTPTWDKRGSQSQLYKSFMMRTNTHISIAENTNYGQHSAWQSSKIAAGMRFKICWLISLIKLENLHGKLYHDSLIKALKEGKLANNSDPQGSRNIGQSTCPLLREGRSHFIHFQGVNKQNLNSRGYAGIISPTSRQRHSRLFWTSSLVFLSCLDCDSLNSNLTTFPCFF